MADDPAGAKSPDAREMQSAGIVPRNPLREKLSDHSIPATCFHRSKTTVSERIEAVGAKTGEAARSNPGSVAEAFRAFLKLGVTSFGGPIAHLGYFRSELVQRRGWIDEAGYGT